MSSGLHGGNGLDPETVMHIVQTCVISVLVYGIELVLQKPKFMGMLEKINESS